ncbi:MAG: hypothetical protein ACXW27_02390 [Allosphingosinicella sp.]
MNRLLQGYVDGLIASRDKAFVDQGLVNYDIFEPRLTAGTTNYTYFPRYMYFLYLRLNDNGKLKVSHFYYVEGDRTKPDTWPVIPYSKLGFETILRKLALNARSAKPIDPPPCDQINFKDILWRRKSYIVFFLDEPHWAFSKKDSTKSPLVFLTEKNGKWVENYTFFDAMELDVKLSDTESGTAILFVNHMKADESGVDLGPGERRDYQFNMFLKVMFEDGTDAPIDIIIDPGGTNQGPPLDP